MDKGSFVPEPCPVGVGEPVEKDMVMTHLKVSRMDTFRFDDVDDFG